MPEFHPSSVPLAAMTTAAPPVANATDSALPDAGSAINALQAMDDGDQALAPEGSTATTAATQVPSSPRHSGWEANELSIASLILAYGVFAIAVSSWLMMRGKDAEAVLRMVGVLSAVVIASFLLVVGYDDKQMNPVIGLLGTIVGYLLGKDQGYNAGTRDAATKAAEPEADPA